MAGLWPISRTPSAACRRSGGWCVSSRCRSWAFSRATAAWAANSTRAVFIVLA